MAVALGAISLVSSVAGTVMGAQAQAAGAKAQQLKAQKAAEIARVQADQADGAYREELKTTLSNIDAIRASAGVSQDSPTAIALRDQAKEDSALQRTRKVSGIRMQANQYDADAAFYGSAARNYATAGMFKAGGEAFGGSYNLYNKAFG